MNGGKLGASTTAQTIRRTPPTELCKTAWQAGFP